MLISVKPIGLLLFISFCAANTVCSNEIRLISKDLSGTAAGACSLGGMSADGSKIVFNSFASDLVLNDTNEIEIGYRMYVGSDVFLYEAEQDAIRRISVDENGNQLVWQNSGGADISRDGTAVAFTSSATNIVSGVTATFNELIPEARVYMANIFRLDLLSENYQWLSQSKTHFEGNESSGHALVRDAGRKVFFASTANNLIETMPQGYLDSYQVIYLWESINNSLDIVSNHEDGSFLQLGERFDSQYDVSNDGDMIVFRSIDPNLVDNQIPQIVLKNLNTNEITIVSKSNNGELANRHCSYPKISGDGRFVVFMSTADNLTDVDPHPTGSTSERPKGYDFFIYDVQNQDLNVISAFDDPDGSLPYISTPAINQDGRYILFGGKNPSLSPNYGVMNIHRYDRITGEIDSLYKSKPPELYFENLRISQFRISPDGSRILFLTNENNIVPEDQNSSDDVYLIDLNEPSSAMDWELSR